MPGGLRHIPREFPGSVHSPGCHRIFLGIRRSHKETFSIISIRCCSRLALREATLVNLTVWKPRSVSWKLIGTVRRKFSIPITIFHKTSTKPIRWKLFLYSLCYQYDGLPGALLSEVILAEGGLYQTYSILTEYRVWGILPSRRSHPGPKVFCSHTGRSPRPVCSESVYFPHHIFLLREGVIHW